MRQQRSLIKIVFIASTFLILMAMAAPSHSQRAMGNGTGALPVSFILDSALEAHEQDIREKMFEYKFEAAGNNSAEQADLVKKRSDELKSDIALKKGMLKALMEKNYSISDRQFAALTGDMSVRIEKLNGWSKKLQERAAGLAMPHGHKAYKDAVESLMSDLNDARELASRASQASGGKKGANADQKK